MRSPLARYKPPNLAQRWLGHARISTTAIYSAASGPEELFFMKRFWCARGAGVLALDSPEISRLR
jgi:hypothetical protein